MNFQRQECRNQEMSILVERDDHHNLDYRIDCQRQRCSEGRPRTPSRDAGERHQAIAVHRSSLVRQEILHFLAPASTLDREPTAPFQDQEGTFTTRSSLKLYTNE